MSDVELVVKIDEKDYQSLKDGHIPFNVLDVIKNGMIIPKGHGRLIDADDLDITTITTDDYRGNEVLDVVLKEDVDIAPTIIEADRSDEE